MKFLNLAQNYGRYDTSVSDGESWVSEGLISERVNDWSEIPQQAVHDP